MTGYRALDERIEKTRFKKANLLLGLDIPKSRCITTPPNWAPASACNAMSALARVRRTAPKPRDTFMTLTATAKKLGVSIYHYIHDRVSGAFEMPDLADTITSAPNCHWAHPGNRHNRFPRIIEKIPHRSSCPLRCCVWVGE